MRPEDGRDISTVRTQAEKPPSTHTDSETAIPPPINAPPADIEDDSDVPPLVEWDPTPLFTTLRLDIPRVMTIIVPILVAVSPFNMLVFAAFIMLSQDLEVTERWMQQIQVFERRWRESRPGCPGSTQNGNHICTKREASEKRSS